MPTENWFLGDNDALAAAQFQAMGLTDPQLSLSIYVAVKVQHGKTRNFVYFDGHTDAVKFTTLNFE